MKHFLTKIILSTFIVIGLLSAGGVALVVNSALVQADTVDEIRGGSNGIGGDTDANKASRVGATVKVVVNILSFLIGTFAVIMIVVSGFRFVTANGDANTVSQARSSIIYALIGLVIAVMAYAVVNFVLDAIT